VKVPKGLARLARPLLALGRVGAVRRIGAIARKELRQLWRDPLTLGFVLGLPAVQLVLFGYAINQDVRHVPTALVDHAKTTVTRRFIGQLEATDTFRFVSRLDDEQAARELLLSGDVEAVVEIPPNFPRAYYRGRGAEISILVNAGDPTVARAVRSAAEGLAERHNQGLTRAGLGPPGALGNLPKARGIGAAPELVHPRFLDVAVIDLFNPELRTALFVVPALLGVILTTTMILMTALALVRERERGTFEFLIATPVARTELMAGKILPYIGIGLVQVAIVLLAGLALFRVPVAGSLVDLGVASAVFIAANLCLGLVISATTSTQLQATQVSFFFFLPSVLLSGFMFPFDAMPAPARWLGELLPLTHYIRLCRGILLRGSTLADQPGELLALAALTAVGFAAATRLFTKRLS
jgi:ABC-2 type transport system permease protein